MLQHRVEAVYSDSDDAWREQAKRELEYQPRRQARTAQPNPDFPKRFGGWIVERGGDMVGSFVVLKVWGIAESRRRTR